ncbi:MAG: ATP-binding cassette domain-containing protein [Thomasclavelia ramosa]
METILNFEDVSYHYLDGSSNVSILNKANYSFEKGKIYAIVGASGSGKTTTIVLAGGLDKPKGGKVIFKGQDTARIGLNKYRRNDISIVFQSYNLIHYMNAYENVANAIEIAGRKVQNKKRILPGYFKKN